MRHLFVPACVCLVTWSGATASDPKSSYEEFTGVSVVAKSADIAARQTGTEATAQEQTGVEASVKEKTRVEASVRTGAEDMTGDGPSALAKIPTDAGEETGFAARTPDVAQTAAVSDAPIQIPTQENIGQALEPQPRPENIPLPPVAKPVVHRTAEEVCNSVAQAADTNKLPVPFFIRLLFQESGFQPEAVSRTGAQGVAQFMPETSAQMGLANPFDPLQAIPAAARLLRNLAEQFGNLGLAAAAYNAGPGRIQSWLTKKSKLPQETQGYVKIITGRPADTWKTAAAGSTEMRLPRRAPCQETAGLYAWNGPEHIPLPPSPSRGIAVASVRVKDPIASGKIRVANQPSMQIAARKKIAAKAPDQRIAKLAAKTAPLKLAAAAPVKVAMATRGAHK